MKYVNIVAGVVTVIWFSVVGLVIYFKWSDFGGMPPNAWGDFLAGTMSPLAFIWLVAGYLQQGKELRLNTEALQTQLKELALQVESTKVIADSTKQQADISRAQHEFIVQKTHQELEVKREERRHLIKPSIAFSFGNKSLHQWQLYAHNTGGDALQMSLESKYFQEIISMAKEIPFEKGSRRTVQLNKPLYLDGAIFITIRCWDVDHSYHVFHYKHDVISNQFILIPPSELPEEQQINPD